MSLLTEEILYSPTRNGGAKNWKAQEFTLSAWVSREAKRAHSRVLRSCREARASHGKLSRPFSARLPRTWMAIRGFATLSRHALVNASKAHVTGAGPSAC